MGKDEREVVTKDSKRHIYLGDIMEELEFKTEIIDGVLYSVILGNRYPQMGMPATLAVGPDGTDIPKAAKTYKYSSFDEVVEFLNKRKDSILFYKLHYVYPIADDGSALPPCFALRYSDLEAGEKPRKIEDCAR